MFKGYIAPKNRKVKVGIQVKVLEKSKIKPIGVVLDKTPNNGLKKFYKVQIGDNVKIIEEKKLKVI